MNEIAIVIYLIFSAPSVEDFKLQHDVIYIDRLASKQVCEARKKIYDFYSPTRFHACVPQQLTTIY